MNRLFKFSPIIALVIASLFLSSVEGAVHANPNRKVTLLTYYGDIIDSTMGLIEDISLDIIVPLYQYIKSETALKYMFFTLLILLCVFNVLGNFNHLFKTTKRVTFIANQDIPKDSKSLQKQIKSLRETVSFLKQQALKNQQAGTSNPQLAGPTQTQQGVVHQQINSQPVQVQLDPSIEQRILKNQQSIDFLKQSLMKIIEIQQDLQKSIVESQREVAQDIQGIRTNKPIKKTAGAHSSQLEKAPHSHSRQSSTSFLEETGENKLQQIAEQVIQQQQQEKPTISVYQQSQQQQQQPLGVEEVQQKNPFQVTQKLDVQESQNHPQVNQHIPPPQFEQQPPITTMTNEVSPTHNTEEQNQPPTMADPTQSVQSAFNRPPPSRPTPFGGRQAPSSLLNKKQPMRTVPTNNTPVVLPPKK